MPAGTLAALLLAGAAPSAADRAALDAAVATIYRPYAGPEVVKPMWEYPVYSTRIAALIDQWRKVTPNEEPDRLSDGDWFCLCQDWVRLRATVTGRQMLGRHTASMRVRVDLGAGTPRDMRLVFIRQQGRWKLDDLFGSPDFETGLKQALRETIAEETKK